MGSKMRSCVQGTLPPMSKREQLALQLKQASFGCPNRAPQGFIPLIDLSDGASC